MIGVRLKISRDLAYLDFLLVRCKRVLGRKTSLFHPVNMDRRKSH